MIVDIMLKVRDLTQKKLMKQDINHKVLLATDNEVTTVLHMSPNNGKIHILLRVWEWTQENLIKEEINNKVFLATYSVGMTAFHLAAYNGKLDILQKVWVSSQLNQLLRRYIVRYYYPQTLQHLPPFK
jgi:hypothetical protein